MFLRPIKRILKIIFHRSRSIHYEGQDDLASQRKHLRSLVELNHGWGMNNLGNLLQRNEPSEADHVEALDLYYRAVEIGSSDGISEANIGSCYLEGWGVPIDLETAAKWFKASAEKGFPPAQYNYGLSLVDPWGDKQDLAAGRKWLERAAETGMQEAKDSLELMDQRGE